MQPTHAAHGGGQTGLLTPCAFRQIFEYDKRTLQKLRDHPAPKAMKEGWGIAYVSTACLPPAPMHAACARVRACMSECNPPCPEGPHKRCVYVYRMGAISW